jgi:hypothetical protein
MCERGETSKIYTINVCKKEVQSIDLLILARTWGDQQIFTAHSSTMLLQILTCMFSYLI